MAKVRSPNYPVVDLSGALAMARKLYEADGRNKVSRQALASHLNHDSLSGPALGKIGALRAYGLIEGTGDENRITVDAITALMAPDGSADKVEAMLRLALQPVLFREISKEFPTPPSDNNLRYWLVKRGYSPDGAAKAAKAYLATIALVAMADRSYDLDSELENENKVVQAGAVAAQRPLQGRTFAESASDSVLAPGMRKEIVTLDEGDVVIVFPANLSAASFEDLEDHLKLFVRKMQRRATAYIVDDDDENGQR